MTAATITPRRKMGLTTILGTVAVIAMLMWGTVVFFQIQTGNVRTEIPHERYSDVVPWPYNINWGGSSTNWFDNMDYNQLPLNQTLPDDLLEHLNDVMFIESPTEPVQLWRYDAYDEYTGSSWQKTDAAMSNVTLNLITRSEAEALGNTIYTVYLNVTAGPNVGAVRLPTLFPDALIIQDSFVTGQIEDGHFQVDTPSRLLNYDLSLDALGVVQFRPLLSAPTGEHVLVAYDLTFRSQDLSSIADNSLRGDSSPPDIWAMYGPSTLDGIDFTQRVIDNISQFEDSSATAFQTATTVATYFQTKFKLIMNASEYNIRPEEGRETTDWFLERGGGLPMDFASSYCVFMRHLGIPARYVAGFAVGDDLGGYRALKVLHMTFWAEVYIPTSSTTGEWVQILPLPLPSGSGTEIPMNTPGELKLYTWANTPQGWVVTGDDFVISALLLSGGVPVSGQQITFRDNTDNHLMGTAIIEQGTFLPLANLTYAYPDDATPGLHNISAIFQGPTEQVENFTYVYVVAQPNPYSPNGPSSPQFTLSETYDVDLSLGLDDYVAYWDDILHVHGVMTVGGDPVDGTTLNNDQIRIMWDDYFMGNATIQSDGSYELDIPLDPSDHVRMTVGTHEVWSEYLGEYNSQGIPILLPARSADNSTVDLQGNIALTLTATPSPVARGGTLHYDGICELRNGTILVGETIGIFFDSTWITDVTTNSTGGFSYDYIIPVAQPLGTFPAQANWTSSYTGIAGNWSNTVDVEVQLKAASLTIDSTPKDPDVVHPYEKITIFGYLTDQLNGSGLVGQDVDIYWDTGSGAVKIGTATTDANGYYEFNYTVTDAYFGSVDYWSEYVSSSPSYEGATSPTLSITVEKWATDVTISVSPSPAHPAELVTFSGTVSVPDQGSLLGNAPVTIWWQNSTSTYNLSVVLTSAATGIYTYSYTIPLNHEFGTISCWAEFVSPWAAFADDVSDIRLLTITNYTTHLNITSNSTVYHLNETAHIWGSLTFENGSPIVGRQVVLSWTNATDTYYYTLLTDSQGRYDFYYNFSPSKDDVGTVDVSVSFTSWTRLHSDASATLGTLTVQLFQVDLTATLDAAEYHQDESITVSGTLTFQHNGNPLGGAMVTIYYRNATKLMNFTKYTDATGAYSFQYNLTLDDALGAIYIWAQYTSTDPLWTDAISANRTATIILYRLSLTTQTNSTSYHLNETIWVSGRLTFQHNGTAIVGESITIHMQLSNGTLLTYSGYVTNSTGYYNFYYNCSPTKDSTTTITIWATYTSTQQLWDDASSSPGVDVDLILYPLQLSLTGPAAVYLDNSVVLTGNLAHQGGSPELTGKWVRIYLLEGSTWTYLGQSQTDSNGDYQYVYTFTLSQGAGDYTFKANYSSTDPLTADAESSPFTVTAMRYDVNIDFTASPTTAKLNESIFFSVHLYFDNGTDIQGETILIRWNNGSLYTLHSETTNSTGWMNFVFTGFQEHTVWTGITSYGEFSGSRLYNANSSAHIAITLEQWVTAIIGYNTTGGRTDYYVTDWVDLSGGLYYTEPAPDVPLPSATITLLFDGTPVDSTVTLTDGSFSISWMIPESTSPGLHTLSVAFYSPDNWIADSTDSITLNISAITLVWTLFVNPNNPAYLSDHLNISGTLYLSNGSPYSGAAVSLYWDHLSDGLSPLFISQVLTQPDGSFEYIFTIDASTTTGFTTVWASCTPSSSYIVGSDSETVTIEILPIPVNLTLTYFDDSAYVGDTINLGGSLHWGNGTGSAMVGYTIALLWSGSQVDSVATDTDGDYDFTFTVPWDNSVGVITFTIQFVRPDASFESAEASDSIEIYNLVTITLNPQRVTVVYRGDQLIVNGTVTNTHGPVQDVPLVLLVDGAPTSVTTTTLSQGAFVLTYSVPSDLPLGPHTFSVNVTNFYYELSGAVGTWDVTVKLQSILSVYVDHTYTVTTGENFSVSIRLTDSDGNLIAGVVRVYLNNSLLSTENIDSGAWVVIEFQVPSSISASGYYVVSAEFDGIESSYIDGSTAEGEVPIHIFTQVVFTSSVETVQVAGSQLVISGQLTDDSPNAIPIVGRRLTIAVNGTTYTATTGDDGSFSVVIAPRTVVGIYEVSIEVPTETNPISVSRFTIQVQANTGGNMQLGDLLIPITALAGAVIAVLLYLYFVRGFFHPSKRVGGVDIPSKLRNIKKLADAGKYDAAVTLAYRTFEQMCGLKTGTERLNSETAREYLDRVLKSLPLDATAIDQFVNIYEEARFSQHEITRGQYEEAVRIFTDLYPRLDVGTTD
ncbi:MAG: DUF4129 domain-containing protein [Candidatus Thorarchaeota archaeon]|nr:DUF4129 domain-containing protein [Candidatus Thorarchaeota archaeon]